MIDQENQKPEEATVKLNITDSLSIDEFADDNKISVAELGAIDRVKFGLAKGVLIGGAVLMLITWVIYAAFANWGIPGDITTICGESSQDSPWCAKTIDMYSARLAVAESIFEFAKSWIPPVITLVLGYYFAKENGS